MSGGRCWGWCSTWRQASRNHADDLRTVVDVMLYITQTGCQGRACPSASSASILSGRIHTSRLGHHVVQDLQRGEPRLVAIEDVGTDTVVEKLLGFPLQRTSLGSHTLIAVLGVEVAAQFWGESLDHICRAASGEMSRVVFQLKHQAVGATRQWDVG